MRPLKFIVDDQIIKQDPNCDFNNLVPGSEGCLLADISFSPEWDGYYKVAAFYSPLGLEYKPQALKDGRTCVIPAEALRKRSFKIRIFGLKKDEDQKRITNKLTVKQSG